MKVSRPIPGTKPCWSDLVQLNILHSGVASLLEAITHPRFGQQMARV
ncbi:hypothetical protein MycrhDRAFT_0733 [Mycolicibacterium rhodesiae JS60]|nr:hypothetical protein MycrhDRAFT_0733 [Mycolicibacterium rhodesiae JS60]